MSLEEHVYKIIEEEIAESPYFLVSMAVSDSKFKRKISIFVDSDEGITIEQCTTLSRAVGSKLEELIDGAFTLELSSPGADSPLKLVRQYHKNIGRTLKITLNNLNELKGNLLEVKDGDILIETIVKKNEKSEKITLSLADIKEARVVISFK